MGYKKSAKERFLDRFLGGVVDWDKHLAESTTEDETAHLFETSKKILKIQEDFGNRTNSELGREMWYSNDFFINSLILNFITDAEDDLVNELKQIFVGILGIPGVDAEALDMDEEFDGYLIKMHFEVDLQMTFISDLVSYHIYGMQIRDERERANLLPKMWEALSDLVDKEALLKKISENKQVDKQVDLESPRLHIATDLFVAGMSFVLGHEIGHHFLKHTESNERNIVSKFIPKNVTSNQLHLDEFAADNFSFDLLIRGMKERNDNTLFAPLIVILMLALYDKTPEEPSQTHPSLRDRYLNLLSRVSEHNEVVALTLQRIFNDVATWINGTLRGYWKTEWWK
ncbi:hypothetical protein [Bacillus sp. RO1]|uniref:hypothetical protein n=1 Tax=Bacillus sp. RO1 TaxID=2722703 RepID=UPI001F0F7B5A|nr:hypothetical protein [Bacillus sp. RO1]